MIRQVYYSFKFKPNIVLLYIMTGQPAAIKCIMSLPESIFNGVHEDWCESVETRTQNHSCC